MVTGEAELVHVVLCAFSHQAVLGDPALTIFITLEASRSMMTIMMTITTLTMTITIIPITQSGSH